MRSLPFFAASVAAIALIAGNIAVAQMEGERGVAPIDSSSDYEVDGIAVDVAGANADAARYGGWRIAQRKGWQQLSRRMGRGGGLVSDATLDAVTTGIIVQNEQIGPKRYVAQLGVLFDRDRASSVLGIATYIERSPPMVVVPVQWSGGVATAFEQRTPWQEAWARYRTGSSTIDYIRPVGIGADPLLLNFGQAQRPGRGWWRTILDQYGGSDVLIPTVRLYRQWPGGPIVAAFEARWGPDDRLIDRFTLRVNKADGLPALLDAGVARLDTIYQGALRRGVIRIDPGLSYVPPSEQPVVEEGDAPIADGDVTGLAVPTMTLSVQFDSPNVAAVSGAEAILRAIPGVTQATTSSLALGGISIMTVGYAGPPDALRAALEARGFQVLGSPPTIRIRRAPQLPVPEMTPDNATAG